MYKIQGHFSYTYLAMYDWTCLFVYMLHFWSQIIKTRLLYTYNIQIINWKYMLCIHTLCNGKNKQLRRAFLRACPALHNIRKRINIILVIIVLQIYGMEYEEVEIERIKREEKEWVFRRLQNIFLMMENHRLFSPRQLMDSTIQSIIVISWIWVTMATMHTYVSTWHTFP